MLLTQSGILKISDFGLAKSFALKLDAKYVLTKYVCTKFYRAPELFYGAQYYGPAIDIWSVGCIFGELYWRKFMFYGETEIDMLTKILSLRGTPSEATWPGVTSLPNYMEFSHVEGVSLKEVFPMMTDKGIDLLNKLLCMNPNKRISATDALAHEYFTELPLACEPSLLPLDSFKAVDAPTKSVKIV